MNAVVARLTAKSLLGRRRAVLILLLPVILLAVCVLVRWLAGVEQAAAGEPQHALAADLLTAFGLAIIIPLLGLIAGTGAIGPEIDDGSIVYLLAKPLRRSSIVLTKLSVAIGSVAVTGALAMGLGAVILTAEVGRVAIAFTVGALIAGIAYCAVFLMLGVVSRNATVIGLLYALIWESLVGQYVPGAQVLSIQQWSLAVTEAIIDSGDAGPVSAAVSLPVAVVLLVVVTVGATWLATARLKTVRISDDA